MAGITVKIGGVDKTEYVDARTLKIRDELTSKVNSASFVFICNNIAVAPKTGEEVLILEGTKKLFSGRILSKKESFLPPNLLKYPVECIDYTRDLDRKLVFESYKNQYAGNIIKDIIDKYTKIGIPTGHNDPDSQWISETNAYDGNTATSANNDISPTSWSSFLELIISSTLCDSVKFYAWFGGEFSINSIDVDVYYDGAWHHIYEGTYADREWVEKSFDEDYLVTKARVRFYNSGASPSGCSLYEFNFGVSLGFTTNNIVDGPIISEIAFDFVQISEVITKIAEICKFEWYIDYDKDIHFFDSSLNPAPFQLDDDQANYKDLIINTDISQLRNRIFIKSSRLKDTFGEIFIYDGVATEWTCKFAPINRGREKLSDPEPAPTREVFRCDFSHDDIYLAMSHDKTIKIASNPNKGIYIYKRDNDSFTQLNYPDVCPENDGHDVSFSPDSTYLTVVHKNEPYVMIYKRSEDTFTKLDNPADLPTGDGWGCDFSPDGVYLAVAHNDSPYITIYKRSGDTFAKLTNPVGLPAGDGFGCKFSPDGVYLAVAHNTTPFITIYKRNGDTFDKLDNPVALPGGRGLNVAWTPNSIYLAVGHDVTPFITVYKRAGEVFGKIADPAELPTGSGYGIDFSPDGTQLAVAHSITPFVTIYTRSGDILGKQADPADLPSNDSKGAIYSHNGKYLAIGYSADPDIIIYKQYNPTIKVDGVIKTIGWYGVDNPDFYDFMLNEKTKVLSIGAAGTSFIDIGSPAIEQEGSVLKEFTHIGKENPANANGKITKVEIFAYENLLNTIVATFTQVEENVFTARDSQYIGTVISGSKQIFSVDLEVAEGDFIGIYFTSGMCMMHFAGGGRWALYGDQSSCSMATFNFTADRTISLYGTGPITEGELTIGGEILVGYSTIRVPICFKREDQDSIDNIKTLECGDGIIEFCLVDNNIDSIAWANEAAKADLLKNADPNIRATFITNRSDIKSGQIITLNSIKRNINQQFIVQSIELIRVDVLTEWPTIPYKPAAKAKIGYKPASEAEKEYRLAGDSGGIIYYIFNVTIANKFKKLEDLFIYLLGRADESVK